MKHINQKRKKQPVKKERKKHKQKEGSSCNQLIKQRNKKK